MASDDEDLIRIWNMREFRTVKTVIPITIELVLITALEILSIVLVIEQPKTGTKCESYFLVLYLHGAYWFVSVLIDYILKYEHHKLRMSGYLEFYRNTNNHHRVPFYIVSLWTTTLYLIQTFIQHFYLDNLEKHCLREDYMTPLTYYCIIISLEFIVMAVVVATYLVKVCKFNKLQPLPDVQKEEWAFTSAQTSFIADEIGHGIQQSRLEDLLEKQADLIQYLREHNEKMNEKIMILNAQLRSRFTQEPT